MPPTSLLVQSVLHWTPRVLCILLAAFAGVFALDVFNEVHGFWQTAFALWIHLIPSLVVLAILSIAWRNEAIGAAAMIGVGLWYLNETYGRFPIATVLMISGPLFLAGSLFALSWVYGVRLHRHG